MLYKTQLKGTADVWYFDKPTIGFCSCCDCTAEWSSVEGLRCPVCGTTEGISIFKWDGESEYPE